MSRIPLFSRSTLVLCKTHLLRHLAAHAVLKDMNLYRSHSCLGQTLVVPYSFAAIQQLSALLRYLILCVVSKYEVFCVRILRTWCSDEESWLT